jgi:hypothetical protein
MPGGVERQRDLGPVRGDGLGRWRARLLAAVNYGATQAQCWTQIPFSELGGRIAFRDLLGDERYERDGAELASKGLYLDLPPWGVNAFAVGRS